MDSFITWIGGKNFLKKRIIDEFPKEYNKYVEVFGGAAWILFYKEEKKEEIYNDYNSELVNLFKIVKYHEQELQRELKYILNSRQLFNEMKEKNINGMTDIQRAARFFVLIKLSYGANINSFRCRALNTSKAVDYISKVHVRLKNVLIENKDFENLIKLYDRENTLFYCDPPYFGTEKYYQVQFAEQDHNRLFNILDNIKGKFILSYNDCNYIRELYKNYNIIEVKRMSNLKLKYSDKEDYKELIIKNY